MTSTTQMSQDWAKSYALFQANGTELGHPSETLIRLFKGDYLTGERPLLKNKRILDIGFGNGNNTAFFASLGMDVKGVEIHQDICKSVAAKFQQMGLPVELRTGSSQSIPFDSNSFDYLVSWNVIHYEGEHTGVSKALAEYHRVLKPGGRLILSSTGPAHKILENAVSLGNHLYQIGREDDFRKGQVHFLFDDIAGIRRYFEPQFRELQIGRINDQLFRETLDWWLVTGIK